MTRGSRATTRTPPAATALVWIAALGAAATLVGIAALAVAGRAQSSEAGFNGLWPLSWFGLPLIGAVVATRRRDEPFGWMLIGVGAGVAVGLAGQEYVSRGLETAPHASLVAWASQVAFEVSLTLVVFVVLLFPTGRVRGRMRQVGCAGAVSFGLTILAYAVRSRIEVGNGATLPNPLSAGVASTVADLAIPPLGVADVAFAVLVIGDAVVRFRRSRGVERLQLRWFATAVAPFPLLMAGAILLPWRTLVDALAVAAFLTAGNGIAIGIAVMRYRLYDIDRVISRTLSYAVVTALLAGVYAALAVGLGTVVRGSSLTVAAATLAVAALFRPLRGRVQRVVDRRFNRARYDAALTVERFSRRLRDEIELGGLAADLGGAAREAMRPRSLSVWLREPAG